MTSESEAQMTATLNDLFVISKREFRCSFAILTGATLKNKTWLSGQLDRSFMDTYGSGVQQWHL